MIDNAIIVFKALLAGQQITFPGHRYPMELVEYESDTGKDSVFQLCWVYTEDHRIPCDGLGVGDLVNMARKLPEDQVRLLAANSALIASNRK